MVAAPAKLTVEANASFRGKEPDETARFWLGLAAHQGAATQRTPLLFKEATALSLSLDSARLEIAVSDYHKDFYELNRLLAESARAEINREDLQKLLATRSLAGQWGGAEFKFSDAALDALKDFISRHVLAANGR